MHDGKAWMEIMYLIMYKSSSSTLNINVKPDYQLGVGTYYKRGKYMYKYMST